MFLLGAPGKSECAGFFQQSFLLLLRHAEELQ